MLPKLIVKKLHIQQKQTTKCEAYIVNSNFKKQKKQTILGMYRIQIFKIWPEPNVADVHRHMWSER